MNEIEERIEIRIRYTNPDGFPADAVAKTIEHIDAVVLDQEGRELETIARDLEGAPRVALDAARHRLAAHSGEGVLFYSASEGSIVLCGVIAGLSAWILQTTLGETLKEAWLESDLHKRLKRLLLAGSRYRAEGIAQGIENRNTISLGPKKKVVLRVDVKPGTGSTIIEIDATLHAEDLPPLPRLPQPEYRESEGGPEEGGSKKGGRAGKSAAQASDLADLKKASASPASR
ncbi:MAG TPA: hypothetical protein VGX68_05155 [Thermoanaerobaculia bacterium]|nr:hypothetical protein [Thermoanaerobaculia bacterium]